MERIQGTKSSSQFKNFPQAGPPVIKNSDKIVLTDKQIDQFDLLGHQVIGGSITIEEAVLQFRGGDGLTNVVGILALVIFINWYDSLFGVQAFQANPLPHQDPFGWLSGKYDFRNVGPCPSKPPTSLEMEKPAAMLQPQYSALTKLEKRQLADPKRRDGFIQIGGYPRLELRFNQVEYKTPKTDATTIALRDSLLDMPNRQDIVWYTYGQYQGGTPRSCDSVNLFDPDTNLIVVYQKQPDGSNLFLTTCKLTPLEVTHLKDTNGNFLPERMIKQQSAISTNIQDPTNTNNDLQ
jgi:hypothetical protein